VYIYGKFIYFDLISNLDIHENYLDEMKGMACILHSTFYGTFCSAMKEKGVFDWEGAIGETKKFLRNYLKTLDSLGYDDLEKVIKKLEETGLYQNVELIHKGNKIVFKIGKCLLAGGKRGVHTMLGPTNAPCPIAIFIAAYIARQNPQKKVYVYSTIYHEEGTTTEIELLWPSNYKRKVDTEKSLIRIRV